MPEEKRASRSEKEGLLTADASDQVLPPVLDGAAVSEHFEIGTLKSSCFRNNGSSYGLRSSEINVHRASKVACDRSFDARSNFMHFADNRVSSFIRGRDWMAPGVFRTSNDWYSSRGVVCVRNCVRGPIFSIFAISSLLVALFCSDVFVVLQIPTNQELSLILSIAFMLFTLEFLILNCVDPAYPLSFFFWMDLVGTISMVFDIPYLLGPDATAPIQLTEGKHAGNGNVVVVRAARAARMGARAGRLSRVVKLIRFLQKDSGEKEEEVKVAKVISNKLSDLLSIRVAFLTICIAMVLPTFSLFKYPATDESMMAWTQMLSHDAEDYRHLKDDSSTKGSALAGAKAHLKKELGRFARFYSSHSYGPYRVCLGPDGDGTQECWQLDSVFSAPKRRASIWEMEEGAVRVFFDMSSPMRTDAGTSIGLISLTIMVMCFFSMILSTSITEIALKPLERMLSTVRQRCAQIFKYTGELQETPGEQNAEEEDTDDQTNLQSNEFELLERAIAKLAAIANLSATKNLPDTSGNGEENDLMMLSWMQGEHVVELMPENTVRGTRVSTDTGSMVMASTLSTSNNNMLAAFRSRTQGRATHTQSMLGYSDDSDLMRQVAKIPSNITESIQTQDFNSLDVPKESKIVLAAYIVWTYPGSCELVQAILEEQVLFKFVVSAEKSYLPNKFHNFSHALDVVYAVSRLMRLTTAGRFLTEVTQYWLLIAAIGHDLGHMALGNSYLIETSDELAVVYNDRSPLENMHCSKLFQILTDAQANVFAQFDKEAYKKIRQGVIDAILHTDIIKHNEMIKELGLLYQMNSDDFDTLEPTPGVNDVLTSKGQMMSNMFLHCADIGNPTKPWALCRRLAYLCLDEFFSQGDAEKAAGIPVQMLNDRNKVNGPNSQIGFIEFMMTPFVEAILPLFPQLEELPKNLGENIKSWASEWQDKTSPAEDDVEKMTKRILKVTSKCEILTRVELRIDVAQQDKNTMSRTSRKSVRRGITMRGSVARRPAA